jgi:membrane protein YdbS with pleckstrin-like domain
LAFGVLAFGILSMYQRTTQLLLRLLRVPHEPTPPHGDPASLRVFRAGRNHLSLKLIGWGATQLLAFAGIVFWISIFIDVEAEVRARRQPQSATTSSLSVNSIARTIENAGREADAATKQAEKTKYRPRFRATSWYAGFKQFLVGVTMNLPPIAFVALWVIKVIGILAYFAQLPATYLIARMDYELRWYMVTDRSLRIRYGVWKVSESTMSFANIQQVVVSQGPLQRLLGLSDVKVQSAGGGSGGSDSHGNQQGGEDMHLGLFHSVTNAPEIRDLILERLRRFRESGLGDPDEKPSAMPTPALATATSASANETLAAARELLAEAKALRAVLR